MHLAEFLDNQGVRYQHLLHPPAFTASRLAKHLRIPPCHILRGVLLNGPEGFFLVVLPASRQPDLQKLADFWGGPVRTVNVTESARLFWDCEWGVICPFGSRYGLITLLDASVPADTWVVLEAGSHFESVLLACADFERLAEAFRFDLSRAEPQATP